MEESTKWIIIGIIAAIIIGAVMIVVWGFGFYTSTHNTLVEKDVNVEQAKGDLQSQYQRRADLIPKLIDSVQASAQFEKSTQTEVAGLRSQAISGQQKMTNARTVQDIETAGNIIDNTLSRLMVVMEKYPELKSTEGFRNYEVQIEGTENRINYARTEYNERVGEYKKYVRNFPEMFIANFEGYSVDKWMMFEAKTGADVSPDITFKPI